MIKGIQKGAYLRRWTICEPTHSIVQFPDSDNDNNPTGGVIDTAVKGKGSIWEWAKKIWKWFHFSQFGAGHSEAIKHSTDRLPLATNYEAHWWNRSVHFDGRFAGPEWDQKDAHECAIEYAKATSIGNLTLLRNFLTTSLRRTSRIPSYVRQFLDCFLLPKARDACKAKLKSAGFEYQLLPRWERSNLDLGNKVEGIIKVLCGYTRKRKLIVPEWADDNMLWT